MKAVAVVPGKHQIKLIDQPMPRITSPFEVTLRMLDVGVCGTDREICAFEYGTPPPGEEHLVIGHESVGQVVEVDAAVTRVKVGDLVVPSVRRPCPHAHCRACREEQQDFCFTGDFMERGIKGRHGFMTEYVVDDQKYMNVVPRELREVAVLVEPLTIAEKALMQIWQVQRRLPWACDVHPGEEQGHCHRAVVLGAGPVGLLGAMLLASNGFDTYVYSKSPLPNSKADLCASFGAKYVSSEQTSPEALAKRVGNIDVVYEGVGASRLAFDVMRVLGTNGIFVFTGVPGRKAPVEVDTDLLMRNLVLKNQVVFGTVNAGRSAFEGAIRDLAGFMNHWPSAVHSLITGRHAVDAYEDLLAGGRAGGIKEVITFEPR